MYEQRRAKVFAWLEENGIDMAYITADANVRYLTGMPNGSVLFLFRKAKAILVPWDAILAGKIAECEEVIPYTDFDRDIHTAAASLAGREQLAGGATIDVPGDIGHLKFTTLEKKLDAYRLRCSEDGTNDFVLKLRMVKDPSETAVLRRACVMTDALIEEIIAGVDSGSLHTETDVALFMERESRKRGAEGMGFDTIAAGPARSFGIHAFPGYTASAFGSTGMSIVDFGINVDGYTSDITMTFIKGRTSTLQDRMIGLVEEAYALSSSMIRSGTGTYEIAKAVDDLFSKADFKMPHSLGHGIGLEVHESPVFRVREDSSTILEPGMIVTLEPGLYDEAAGGVRLENDFLVTETGAEVLTNSRLIRIPE